MRSLGAEIDVDGTTLRVKGTPRFRRGAELNCGNSGTTIRLLTGFVAGKGIDAKLYGDNSLSARPMNRVAEPLSRLNADVRTTDGHAPVYVYPSTLSGADVELKIASAQVKSAVLLAGISAEGETRVSEPVKSRDHTERMLAAMGADIRVDGNAVTVRKSELKAVDVCVPSDISSAAYFMALGALKGKTLCKNVGINPTRTGILTAFNRLGVKYTLLNKRISGGEETADILVERSDMRGIELTAADVPAMIDELPLVALLCDCEELPDGFVIRGKKKLVGGDVNSYLDHRIAMTAAVGLIASERGGNIKDPECCAISFPDFFDKLGLKLY